MAFGSRSSRRGSRPLLARWRHGAMSPSTSPIDKKSQSRTAANLSSILQRLPLFSHIIMLGLALYGPTQGQYYVAAVFFTLHIVLVSSQLRTAYGMIRCLYFIREHVQTNWWNYYLEHAKTADPSALETTHTPRTLPQLIVIPSYKESLATLNQTLSILASHPLAKATYKVCLAMEEREAGSKQKGENLRKQYMDQFLDISVSLHPSNIPGEVAGKGSNVGWGARWLVEREFMLSTSDYDDDDDEEDRATRSRSTAVPEGILTVMDADTAFASDYFLAASVKYLLATPERRERMMFVPPIIFDRNQADVPGITRVTDIMWAAVGIGGIYPSSLVKVPTSAYSVSIGLATHVGFWDTGPDAIGEDMHMFCKSLLDTRGHLHVETIYSPASQCNVIGPRPTIGTQSKVQRYIGDSHARWTQGVRHLWGSLDTAYVWSRFLTGDFGVSPQREAEHRLQRLDMRRLVQQERNNYDGADRYASDSDYNANDYFTRPQTSKAGRVRLQVRTDEHGEMELFRKKGPHQPGRHISRLPTWALSPGMGDTESSASSFIAGDTSPPSPIDTQSDYSFSSVGDDGSPTNLDMRPPRVKASRATTKKQLESIGLMRDRVASAPAPAERRMVHHTRFLPILVLLIRLYEAHLMIGHFVILVSIIVFWPPLRDLFSGTYVFQTPKADFWNWAVIEERWSWRDKDRVLNTAIELAWRLGVVGAVATVVIWIYHDRYHQEACKRWSRQAAAMTQEAVKGSDEKMDRLELVGSDLAAGFDPHDLGLRPSPFSERRLPGCLYEYVSMPGGLLFGAIPLLYSQFWHLWTDKLAYTVSAKPTVGPITIKEKELRE